MAQQASVDRAAPGGISPLALAAPAGPDRGGPAGAVVSLAGWAAGVLLGLGPFVGYLTPARANSGHTA